MENRFSNQMAKLNDRQLAEILTIKFDDYQAEAIIAAEFELKKRNINATDIIPIEIQESIEHSKVEEIKSEKPIGLNLFEKILILISPFIISYCVIVFISEADYPLYFKLLGLPITIILQMVLYRLIKVGGNETKAKDFKNWSYISWMVIVGIFIVSNLLKFRFW